MGVVGTGAILASLMLIGGAFGIGWVLGGAFGDDLRDEMALGTSQRNFAPAASLLSRHAHRQRTVA